MARSRGRRGDGNALAPPLNHLSSILLNHRSPLLTLALAVVLLSSVTSACIDASTDPVALGEICAPATASCSALAAIERDAVGRNQLDYTIDLTGDLTGDRTGASPDQPVEVEVLVLVPSTAYDPTDPGAEIPDSDILARNSHTLAPGGTARSRLTPQQLGVRDELSLVVRCTNCEARLLYVFANAPLECGEDDDCSGGWVCDGVFGRCVECLSEEQCDPAQTCDEDRGRCDPPTDSSCASVGPSADLSAGPSAGLSTGLLAALFLLALVAGTPSRRRRWRDVVALSAVLMTLLWASTPASAAPPRGALSLSGGPRFLTGPIGRDAERGIGLAVGQELRWAYFGLGVELSTAFYLTTQQPPPFSNTLQTYAFTGGPRGYLPLGGDLEIVLGADYRRLGLAANSLVRQTGTETSFHAYGASGGLRYRWSAFELRVGGGYHPIVGLDGAILGLDASVAITTAP